MWNIACTATYTSDDAIIVCYANDSSDAPATGIMVTVPGLNEPQYHSFEQIPAHNFEIQVVTRDLTDIAAGNYTVSITALNLIKNQSVFEKTYYVPGNVYTSLSYLLLTLCSLSLPPSLSPGLKANVDIVSESNETAEGDVFSFKCRTPVKKYHTNFTILFNDEYTPINNNRLVNGPLINGTQVFNLTDPTYLDNGLSLMCSANGSYNSPPLRLDVLCKFVNKIHVHVCIFERSLDISCTRT